MRIRQRAYTDDTRSLSDFLSYVFPFDEAAWVLSVFLDPLEPDRWLPEMGDTPVVPDPRPWIDRSRLIVDRQAGTAVWASDTRKQERVELRLGDAPGELAAVVRVLARSLSLPQTLFEQMWPFDLLDRTGLPVREERFRNTRLMHAALPGSAPFWPLTAGYGWFLLTVTAGLAVLFGLATLVVVTGWG